MSGKPYPEGATRTIEIIGRMATVHTEAQTLCDTINAARARLQPLREEYAELQKEFEKLIRHMDLALSGNWGYEGRMAWFLGEIHRQAQTAVPRTEPDRISGMVDEAVAPADRPQGGPPRDHGKSWRFVDLRVGDLIELLNGERRRICSLSACGYTSEVVEPVVVLHGCEKCDGMDECTCPRPR